jgi:AcrR family transcriptional regulator
MLILNNNEMKKDTFQPVQFQSDLTKDILLNAAIAEFNQNGYFNTSVDSITKRAGVSHGTFYLYFKNKQDVISILIGQLEEKIIKTVSEKNNDEEFLNPKNYDSFEQDIYHIVSIILDSSGLFKAFIQGMVQNRELFDLYSRMSFSIKEVFNARIQQKKNRGIGSRIDSLILAQIMSVMFYLSIFIYTLDIIQCEPDVLAGHIALILFSVFNFDQKSMKNRKKKAEIRKEAILKTKQDLVNMAKEEFSRYGYFDTKIGDIAKKAGYSRGTFYQYFTDKDDIIQAILFDMFYQNKEKNSFVDLIMANLDVTSLDELIRASSIAVSVFEKYSSFNWSVLQGAFFSEKLYKFYRNLYIQIGKPIQERIRELQRDGVCQGLDPMITAEIILTVASYSAAMFFGGFINCTKEIFADNMGIFLYSFINYVDSH